MGKGVPIGFSTLYYALLLNDPEPGGGAATYSAPKRIAGAISGNVNPNSSNATLFADDGPYETASTIGEIGLELNVADLTLEEQAEVLGTTISGGVLIRKSTDIPPFLAVGFKSLKSNGSFRYTWLAKGKFAIPEQNNQTKGDSIEYNTPTISASFLKRDCDDEWQRQIDEDSIDYIPSMGANWFNSPYGSAADNTAPTISSIVPANNATGFSVSGVITWTFSESLALSTLTYDNFVVIADATGAPVAGELTVNAARTIVTFTPAANLTAATAYRTVVTRGVKDISGNALAAASTTKFTTA